MAHKKTLLHILMHIGKLLREEIANRLSPLNLHHGQGRVLVNLKRHGAMTQADLARGMNLKPPTMTTMLKPLIERKLINRELDPKTNRAVIVGLSEQGLSLAIEVEKVWASIESSIINLIPDCEQEQIFGHLEVIRDELGGKGPNFNRKEDNHA